MDDLTRVMAALRPEVVIDGRSATAWYEPEGEHRGNPGWLHGGLAAYLLDHVCARAASAALGDRVVTGTLALRYRRPVLLAGGPYRLHAEAAAPRGRTVSVVGSIADAAKPMIEAKALFVVRPDLASDPTRLGCN